MRAARAARRPASPRSHSSAVRSGCPPVPRRPARRARAVRRARDSSLGTLARGARRAPGTRVRGSRSSSRAAPPRAAVRSPTRRLRRLRPRPRTSRAAPRGRRDAREDRRDGDRGRDARRRERCDRAQALRGRRDRRLDPPRERGVERRQAHRHVRARNGGEPLQHVHVAQDERRARRDRRGRLRAHELLEHAARDAIARFERLVGIGRRADEDQLVRPGRPGELATNDLGRVDLRRERRAPIRDAVALEERVRGARVAEDAVVRAAAIRVERPAEAHAADPVDHRLGLDLDAPHAPDLYFPHRTHVRCPGLAPWTRQPGERRIRS